MSTLADQVPPPPGNTLRAPFGRRWDGCDSLAHLRGGANKVRIDAYELRRGEIDTDLTRRHQAGVAIQRALRERPIPRHRALVPISQVIR